MLTTATHFVSHDWFRGNQGKDYTASIFHRNQKRKIFGLLEKPLNSLPPHLSEIEEYQYKIFVSGKSGVGKTSTVATLSGNNVPPTHSETPGIQSSTVYWPAKMKDIDKVVMFQLQFWDAGENSLKKFDHVLPACKEKADAIMFMFSFVDKNSFDDIPSQMSRVLEPNDNVCRFVVGTKIDQHAQSEITQRDIREFEHQWKLPIMNMKNASNIQIELNELAPIMNYICDQLWLRDQILAGRIRPPDLTDDPKISFC